MELGQTLAGRYKIIERIGSGGMSTVYRAHEIGLEREVAIKVLLTALTSDAGLVERFNREAKTIANLQHPNIIPIYFYGTEETFGSFLVMPLLKGGTLDQRLKQLTIRPSLTEVGELADKLGSALQFAHDRGIVHRDIKFSNIMFDEAGSPYLSDFGIAKMLGGTNLTGTGMTVGTPQFMPPEQWRNDDITPAVDQYALGVLLYAMLTQHMPFDAPTPHALMYQHLQNEPPRASEFREDVPQAIEEALTRALAKEPKDRFPTISEFTSRIAETARMVTREYSGFFKAPIEYVPPPSSTTAKRVTLPDTPTEMVGATQKRDEKPPTQIVSETKLTTPDTTNRRAFYGGMFTVLLVGLLAVGGIFAYLLANQPEATEVALDITETFVAEAVTEEPTEETEAATEEITQEATVPEPSETKLPTATATETYTPSITPSNTPDLTTTALAAFATNSANQLATDNAQLRLTGTALSEFATQRYLGDMTATQAAAVAIQTAEANANAAATATVAAATAIALESNIDTTSTAIAIANQQSIQTATAASLFASAYGTSTAFANNQSNIATQNAAIAATTNALSLIPTNTPAEGDSLSYGQAQFRSGNGADSMVWYFEGHEGDVITISASSRDFDTFLEIYYNGNLIASDDDSGYETDSRIINVELQENDIYAVLLRSYAGQMNGNYTIGITEMLDCPSTQPSRLLVGELARVTLTGGANRLRLQTDTNADVVDNIPEGGSFRVLEGPVCADGFAWYRVEYNGAVGWTAEGDDNEYWLETIPEGAALLLTGGRGLTDGAELDAGAFQVEYFCTERGYSSSNDGNNWFCDDGDDHAMTLSQSDFDQICRETYHNDEAFARQDGEGDSPAFRWRCYAYP